MFNICKKQTNKQNPMDYMQNYAKNVYTCIYIFKLSFFFGPFLFGSFFFFFVAAIKKKMF